MSTTNSKLTRVADNIRILSAAMVEKAKSGHPGGAMGGAELGYYGFFKDIFGEQYVNTAMMLWRIMTFYLPIIVGLVFTLTMKNKGIVDPTDEQAKEALYEMEKEIETHPETK